ncbi:uncharacterized protein [Atheta coriaria]|uniref:uncharacterized protein n=1 Tax=Dalotia coriaria TaxID=877792 RepID=UPI0031F37C1B
MLRGARLTCYLIVIQIASSQDFSNSYDIRTLSELSIDQLLSVKNKFELPSVDIPDEDESEDIEEMESRGNTSSGPVAMALRRRSKPRSKTSTSLNRGGWEAEEKGKKGIGSIFQMSITTLAFLAFGGYLLCLVVQSLKDKGHSKKIIVIQQTTAAPVTTAARRRRRRRRPVRIRRPQRQKRTVYENQGGLNFDGPTVDMTPHVNAEAMLDALVSLSEAYTRYHTVDYRRINQTIIHF